MKKVEKSIELGGRKLTLSTGQVAAQADGAVMAQYGDTVVLATVVASPLKIDLGYFPLTVDYQERLYAGGRIKGSRWIKREGRPSDEEILTSRLVDRSIRPLFPKNYKKEEVQLILTVLSVDLENAPEIVAAIAASAAIAISRIPWDGPVGVLKVGTKDDGTYITNPVTKENETSSMDMIISWSNDAVVMIEAGSKEVPEKDILEGIAHSHKEAGKIIGLINDLVKVAGVKKESIEKEKSSLSLEKKVKELTSEKIKELIKGMSKKEAGDAAFEETKSALLESLQEEERNEGLKIFEELFKNNVREMVLSGKRPDSRKPDEIRDISCEVSVLPRTHGSAIFNRGQTQALTITTLGAHSLEQLIESAEGEETKRYIHHYSMPPYSSGETGRIGAPSRREIGHGALAERALLPVIPSEAEFPYTIRVVSEVLSSNGSTSMASTCGSTLSLMDAGVPIKTPIAGIAMGLVIESDKKFVILTDIAGLEDAFGDMDFKVAGSAEGVTALQLDVKSLNLTLPVLEKALVQAKEARLKVLKIMSQLIDKPRPVVSVYAPKIKVTKIDTEKIGELIGPGGKTIRKIIAETGAQVDVDEDGTVYVSAMTGEEVTKALERIEGITKEPQPGEIYDGVVKRIQTFGAFVEILPGKEGLVHISDMSQNFVKDPSDLVKIGDKVKVRVKEIDELRRLNLSMNLDPGMDRKKEDRRPNQRRRFDKGPRDRFSGPHFPTSRFLGDEKRKYSR